MACTDGEPASKQRPDGPCAKLLTSQLKAPGRGPGWARTPAEAMDWADRVRAGLQPELVAEIAGVSGIWLKRLPFPWLER